MIFLVNPVGDFPLNDDWSYGRAVKSVIEQGEFKPCGWTGTNLIAQVYWGALFCFPFGFSFTALRFSTLTLGLIGVLSTYGLLRLLNTHPKYSFLGALLVALNPIYFELSNTFMNDVPFFAFGALSLFFLFKGLKHDSKTDIVVGLLVAYISILCRQTGLALPLAFGFAYIAKKGLKIKSSIIGFLPALLGFGLQFSYQKWLQITERLPVHFNNQLNTLYQEISKGLYNIISNYASILLFSIIYLGLFILPFLILLYVRKFKEFNLRTRIVIALASLSFVLLIMKILISKQILMPFVRNILYDFGLGPVIMKNTGIPRAPNELWILITATGLIGGVILTQCILLILRKSFRDLKHNKTLNESWVEIFIISNVVAYFVPLGFLGLGHFGFYDRYLIFLLPLLLMTVAVATNAVNKRIAGYKLFSFSFIFILLYGLFSIGATHDYLSWNRARWGALNHLINHENITPKRIDGGFEFNAWYLYDPNYMFESNKSWYWVDRDDYVVSFKSLPGYREIGSYPFRMWMPYRIANILVLKKISVNQQ